MFKPIHDKIMRSIQDAECHYYRLVLVVGEAGSGKTQILQAIAKEFGTKIINVNWALSKELLELTNKQRLVALQKIIGQITANTQSPVVLDNLEILFDKTLKQDPLQLLQKLSRNQTVLASWNGTMNSGKLIYAENGHSEYRCYDKTDALVVCMDGTATIDLSEL